MGELLRAVLDATAINSNPAFYTSRISLTCTGGQPADVFVDRSGFLECKQDTWFLMTGWQQSAVAPGAPAAWSDRAEATTFSLRDVKSGRRFNPPDLLVQKVCQNFSLNSFVTLPEYTLWEPASLIEVIQNVQTATILGVTMTVTYIVTLAGIEYELPDRPGGYLNGKAA